MNLEIHYADEWAALYIDGHLDHGTVGDSYHAEERAFELLGVKQVRDDAWMRGQTSAAGVAQTLDGVAAYRRERDEKIAEAGRLRDQAAELIAQAKELDGGR